MSFFQFVANSNFKMEKSHKIKDQQFKATCGKWMPHWTPLFYSLPLAFTLSFYHYYVFFWHYCTLAVPKFILPNFGNFLRRHLASRVKSKDLIQEWYWGRLPPAGLG